MKYLKKLNEVVGNYSDFINEEVMLESLLLESNIVYSPRMRLALQRIKSDPIAYKLLDIENKDIETPSNYFDIMLDKNDTVTFTPDRKVKEILKNDEELVVYTGKKGGVLTHNIAENGDIFNELGYVPEGDGPYRPNNTEIGKIISKTTSKQSGKLFCYVVFKGGKGVFNNSFLSSAVDDKKELVWKSNRQEIKVGRIARVLLKNSNDDRTAREIEMFVNSYKAIIDVINDKFSLFETVSGEELGYWYHNSNYFKISGSLGGSCQSPGRLDWLSVYIKNPETVSLLICKSEDDPTKITGRALLWKLDDPSGKIYMDYTYSINEAISRLFYEYADENGFLTDRDGVYVKSHIKPIEYSAWPSIDTMRYWDPKTGVISSRNFTGSSNIYWGPKYIPSGYYNPLDSARMSYEEYYKKLHPQSADVPNEKISGSDRDKDIKEEVE